MGKKSRKKKTKAAEKPQVKEADKKEQASKKWVWAVMGAVVVLGLAAGGGFYVLSAPPVDKVILISVDTLRADHLGCYNPSVKGTDSIDALAGEGVLFEDAVANITKTTASHACMLSGWYTWSHGVRANNRVIPQEVVLLPEILKEHGWTTGGFVSLSTVKGIYGFTRGFDVYDDQMTILGPAATGNTERRAMETIDKSLAWLGQHRNEKAFLFLHLADPHGPYWPPQPYQRDLPKPRPDRTLPLGSHNYVVNAIPKYQVIRGHKEIDYYAMRYMAEIRYVDDSLGKFFNTLKEWGIYDKSLIIFTSDHGEALGEHGQWFQHGSSLYFEQAEVPLVVKYPEIKPARVKGLIELVDIPPFILEYLGIEVPGHIEGKSFLAWTRDPALEPDKLWYGDITVKEFDITGIQVEGMKLLYESGSKRHQLFNVSEDPAESRNLASSYPEIVDKLDYQRKLFISTRRGLKSHRPRLPPEQRRKEREALRSLGYLE